jgi:uncharacterized membrane protein YkoI
VRRTPEIAASLVLAIAIGLVAAGGAGAELDHERARRARLSGRAVPLAQVLDTVGATFEGRFLEVELEEEDGRLVYEIELLTPQGNVIELEYDAKSGAFLSAEGKGVEAARKPGSKSP